MNQLNNISTPKGRKVFSRRMLFFSFFYFSSHCFGSGACALVMQTQMGAEFPNLYIANLPKEQQESKDFVRCICLDKETTSLSDDGKRLLAYLKRSDMSEITELDPNGKELRKYVKKNEEIATECLKHPRGKWNTDSPSLEKRLLQKSVSTSKNKKL